MAPPVVTDPPAADRIAVLKRLHEKWTTELEQLVHVNPDLAAHLAEALDDLQIVIRRYETEVANE